MSRINSQSSLETPEEVHALSLTALGDSICVEILGTIWAGKSGGGKEIRRARPHKDTDPWNLLKERWIRIEHRSHLLEFLTSGGHALINQEVIYTWWPELFAPTECFRYDQGVPFLGNDYLPPGAEERYPPPLIRRRVFARDDYRCRICGHSPEDHSAIKLEIHHVVEHALGGLTIENNLLTLCKNCHETATPPDPWLRGDMFDRIVVAASRFHRQSHEQGVADYRTWVARALGDKGMTRSLGAPLDHLALDHLTMDDLDDAKRYAKWHFAYARLAANSLVRYFSLSEWRRNLPTELKRR